MIKSFPKLHTTDEAQEFYTPPADAKKILQFIPEKWTIYECCWGRGDMADAFIDEGYKVIGGKDIDFFNSPYKPTEYDCIITNPPWRNHKDFVEKAIDISKQFPFGKPFAFLLRLEHLAGVRAYNLFSKQNIQIIIPKKRINFITPKMREGIKVGGSPFHSIWITRGLVLKQAITWIE